MMVWETNRREETYQKKKKIIRVRTSGCRRAVYRIRFGRVIILKAIRRLESIVSAGEMKEVDFEVEVEVAEDEDDEDEEKEDEEEEEAAKGGDSKEPFLLKNSIPKGPILIGKLQGREMPMSLYCLRLSLLFL